MRIASDADVVLGMHGAALSNIMWMSQHTGGLVELCCGSWCNKQHFGNMAVMLSLPYTRTPVSTVTGITLDEAEAITDQAVEMLDS